MTVSVDIGAAMWSILRSEFAGALKENTADSKQRAQVWAGFLAGAAGAMSNDLGKRDAITVLEGVLAAVRETPHLLEVTDGEKRSSPQIRRPGE
jgi:hypothetical protein